MTRSVFRIALAVLIGLSSPAAVAVAGDVLADRHSVRGVGCADCHGKSSPHYAMTSEACVACHGALKALASQPARAGHNPHGAPGAARDCLDCHRAHAP